MEILLCVLFFFSGCTPLQLMREPVSPRTISDLHVTTSAGKTFFFRAGDWKLTFSGISGKADVTTENDTITLPDTTLSYFDVAAVDGNREEPLIELLLTILGVIIVIGLAGVILYAAFRATER